MLTKRKKANAIKNVQLHEGDTGSTEAKIAILTKRIEEVTNHLKIHKNDILSKRGLIQMVADRRKHLKYLEKYKPTSLKKVAKTLGLRA